MTTGKPFGTPIGCPQWAPPLEAQGPPKIGGLRGPPDYYDFRPFIDFNYFDDFYDLNDFNYFNDRD